MSSDRDWIRSRVVERAAELGLTPAAIATRTGGKVSDDHVRAYMDGRKSMTSALLQHVLDALGLAIERR